MATPNKVIREYHTDDSFWTRPGIFSDITEYQLCLAFATDSGKGEFTPQWNTDKVTPKVIEEFKKNCDASDLPVKVFVSIGGNDPFKVGCGADDWILHATTSLHDIINKYHIDGIDVNYTTFEGNKKLFVNCIKTLIKDLRGALGTAGLVASLAPDALTNEAFYLPLYQAIDQTWIGTVVFQCFVDFKPQDPNKPVSSLVSQVKNIVEQYNHKDTKVLLGYSAIKDDEKKVSPPVFFLALNSLVQYPPSVKGASVKVISDAKADIYVTKWTPQFLSLAVDDAAPRR